MGFDVYFKPEDIPTRGIASVLPVDIEYAKANGLALRLCARAEKASDGAISAYVEPTLVSVSAPEAAILSNVNYAWYEGESYGLMSYIGQGAGKLPTAANVLRDVRSVDAGHRYMTTEACAPSTPDNTSARHAYYLRVPAGTEVPAEWIAKRDARGDWDIYETAPVSVQDMHARMAENKAAFFAGIRKG